MSKSPADKIKEAAAGETDPKALSMAAVTEAPRTEPLAGERVPVEMALDEAFRRINALEKLVDDLGKQLISKQIKGAVTVAHSVEDRLDRIEKRLHGVVSE